MEFQTIPVLRIFDVNIAKEFYLGFLGLKEDWEHHFEEEEPVYIQVSSGDLILHLSEHSQECSPGAKIIINTPNIDAIYEGLNGKNYKNCRPSITTAPWGSRIMEIVDPFSNRLVFHEP